MISNDRKESRTANEQFCKSWGKVQNSTVVLLLNSSAKLNFSASMSQPSQSCQNVIGHSASDSANINGLTKIEQTKLTHHPIQYRQE